MALVLANASREVPAERGLRLSLLVRLARRPRWLGGILLSAAAVGPHTLALTLAPLTVVQPAEAAGLVLLSTVGSRVLGERFGPRELTAVAGLVLGISAIVISGPARSPEHSGLGGLLAGVLVLGAVAASPYVPTAGGRRAG